MPRPTEVIVGSLLESSTAPSELAQDTRSGATGCIRRVGPWTMSDVRHSASRATAMF